MAIALILFAGAALSAASGCGNRQSFVKRATQNCYFSTPRTFILMPHLIFNGLWILCVTYGFEEEGDYALKHTSWILVTPLLSSFFC
jgi:hypothetical protein